MAGQDPRRLGVSLQAFLRDVGGLFVVGGGLACVTSRVFTFEDAAELADGIAFTDELPVNTLVYDAGVWVPTAFDGTTPLADLGTYEGGETGGFVTGITGGNGWDLTTDDGTGVSGLSVNSNPTLMQTVGGSAGYVPIRITTASTLKAVASQDGAKGGDALDSAAGEFFAWALVALP